MKYIKSLVAVAYCASVKPFITLLYLVFIFYRPPFLISAFLISALRGAVESMQKVLDWAKH